MIRFFLILLFGLSNLVPSTAQVSSEVIDSWIDEWPYDNPAKSDSILLWADKIETESSKIEYQRGVNYALRFRAYFHHFAGDLSKATDLYLSFLKASKNINHLKDELSAISDLVYTYISIDKPDKAKVLLLQVINHPDISDVSPKQLSSFYNNLGIVYSQTEKIDSAAWAYNESLQLKEEIKDLKGLTDLRINLSSLYIKLGEYHEAIQLSDANLEYLKNDGNPSDVIYNLINKSAGLIEIGNIKEAETQALAAVKLAEEIGDKPLQQLSTSSLSSLYVKNGGYEKAYEYLLKSEQIKSELLDEQSNIRITELRELYEAEKREQDNKLLSAELVAQENQLKFYSLGIAALLLLLGMLTWFWRSNKNKNSLLERNNEKIQEQNEKLTELNTDKNNLISMVSHDLSSPFSTIKIWALGLSEKSDGEEITETKEAILSLSDHALKSIKKVLTIDNEALSSIDLSDVLLFELINEAIQRHQPSADQKDILLTKLVEPVDLKILTDGSMLSRILDNLITNALKYSQRGGDVFITAVMDTDTVILSVKDSGVGISLADQDKLFDEFETGSIEPLHGEPSHGLGLAIVRRLVDELGGVIGVKSELGQGATFSIRLPI